MNGDRTGEHKNYDQSYHLAIRTESDSNANEIQANRQIWNKNGEFNKNEMRKR